MYRMNSTGRELWRWTQSAIFQPSHRPNGRVADSLDETKAAFRAACHVAFAVAREDHGASTQRQGGSHASRTDCPCRGSRWIDGRYSDGCRPIGGVILSRTLLCAEGGRAAELQLQDLRAMQIYNRPRGGPILHREPMVARAARTAVDARQEPAAQSSVMSLTLAALFGATGQAGGVPGRMGSAVWLIRAGCRGFRQLPSRRSRCSCQRRLHSRAICPRAATLRSRSLGSIMGPARSVREARMRLALIALVTVAAGLTADIRTAAAQAAESFFQERYCARRANGRLSCNYKTLEQCKFTTDPGAVRYCIESPWWHGPRGQSSTQGKSRRHNR